VIIALDYDGTYTAAPALWDAFRKTATLAGHEVLCVTMRHEQEGADVLAALPGVAVIFTGRKAKRPFVQSLGIDPQIWIDDNPAWIYQDAP
jgi:hypothetical protein